MYNDRIQGTGLPMNKILSPQQITGELGATLVKARMLKLGQSFNATGALDAGIDGYIEVRDTDSGEVKAQHIAVQIKTRESGRFSQENEDSFTYICEQKDLDYWLGANLPVLLIAVRAVDDEIYWKSIQGWFGTSERANQRKIVFDKSADILDESSLQRLLQVVAEGAGAGVTLSIADLSEELDINLLKVAYPEKIYVARTDMPYAELRNALYEAGGNPPKDWILHGKRIWSFRDLSKFPFSEVVEDDTVEWIGTREWIASDGEVTRRHFVDLLRRTLSEMHHDVLRWDRKGYLFFKKSKGKESRKHSYRSFTRNASRDVVKGYGKAGERPSYYRHIAFYPNFVEFGGEWFLAIETTYHFTSDGFDDYRYGSEKLAGIKRLETNQSVRGHIGMWKAFLAREADLLRADPLSFQEIGTVKVGVGLDDESWRPNEDEEERNRLGESENDLLL